MSPQQWHRVREVLDAAWDLPPGDREPFLDTACAGDQELRARVDALLAADCNAGGLISHPVAHFGAPDIHDRGADELLAVGRHVGPYTIVERIGSGGMGTVYRAVREDDFRMEVAVKLLTPTVDTAAALTRFRVERQILATLDHPNIARLLDGGTTDSGLPYLVMEYVAGKPLTEYAASLPLRRSLELFRSICSAVQYAHDKRIVHRDFKPANILVTAEGVPKLLDFGIAKLLEPDPALAARTLTGAATRLMTPAYASPEQVRGERITPATDIYSLGAILYELLTGTPAHSFRSYDLEEIQREICTRDPRSPSALIKTIDRDLDNVVSMAMRREPERRYASAKDLADDIDRVLQDLPVRARPESYLYRSRKFLKRRRTLLVTAVLSALAALAAAGVFLFFYLRRPPPISEGDSLVLADITNSTRDPVLNDSLRQAVSIKLTESPFLNILSDERMSTTLKRMGRSVTDPITADVGREICLRNAGVTAVVSGSIVEIGGRYNLQLQAVNCATGQPIARASANAAGKSQLPAAIGKASVQLRRSLGESLASIRRLDKPLEVATSSLEALKAFTGAIKLRQDGNKVDDRIALLKYAIELDPAFGYAYLALATEYYNRRQVDVAAEYARKGFELRDRVTERDEFIFLDKYYGLSTGQLEDRIQSAKTWTFTYPFDDWAFFELGVALGLAGQNEAALDAVSESLRLNPERAGSYGNAMGYYAAVGRLDDAKRVYDEARKRNISTPRLFVTYYDVASLRNDSDGISEALHQVRGNLNAERELLLERSLWEVYKGRLRSARKLLQPVLEPERPTPENRAFAAKCYATLAISEALLGSPVVAREHITRALALGSDRDVLVLAAWTLARSGDAAHARDIGQQLEGRYPLNTILTTVQLPALRASLKTSAARPAEAIRELRGAEPYDFALTTENLHMYAVYVRAEAQLRVRNYAAAASDFEKILDHPGVVMNSPLLPLAQLGAARAYSHIDKEKAKAGYERFFKLWQSADRNLPELVKAQREQRALR